MELRSNVSDVALIFEGGGMRGAYSAGVMAALLGEGIFFDYVCGISAGSSNTVSYIARSPERARAAFVDFADDPRFGSWWTWIQGKGLFNAKYIYEETYLPDGPLPFDFESFSANPAQFRIGAFDAAAAQTIYWSRQDIKCTADLMRKVRASSSIPLVMPTVDIDGRLYVDGALGVGGGLALSVAQRDGYTKFFVVRTRERTYVKPPYRLSSVLKILYHRYPAIAEGIAVRHTQYNATHEELLELERQGQAYIVFPKQMTLTNQTRDVVTLQAGYEAGLAQGHSEAPAWKDFLNLN